MFREIIEDYLDIILKKFDVKGIILFGSLARGGAKKHSDVDLLVVASELPDIKERAEYVRVKKSPRIQAIWVTPQELDEMIDAKTGFIVDSLLEGNFLYDDGTIQRAKKKLEESLKRLNAKRLKHGWFIPRDDLREPISFD